MEKHNSKLRRRWAEARSIWDESALRSQTEMYAVYKTGDRELYNLTTDPLELHNLANDPNYDKEINGQGGLNDQLRQMCSPPPPNWHGP